MNVLGNFRQIELCTTITVCEIQKIRELIDFENICNNNAIYVLLYVFFQNNRQPLNRNEIMDAMTLACPLLTTEEINDAIALAKKKALIQPSVTLARGNDSECLSVFMMDCSFILSQKMDFIPSNRDYVVFLFVLVSDNVGEGDIQQWFKYNPPYGRDAVCGKFVSCTLNSCKKSC